MSNKDIEQSKDYWWVNDESLAVLNRGYLLKGEEVKDAVERVVKASSSYLPKELRKEYEDKLRRYIAKGYMSLSSPIWSNMGTKRGYPISCFGLNIDDNMQSITYKLGEVIMQTKLGGGTSGYFGALRGRGAAITDNGKSNGSVAFMELFNSAMNVISQGSTRRGSFAAYLDIDHPDIEEFLQIRDIGNTIQSLFYAVCVPDYWLAEMKAGDIAKRKIWAKVLESRQHKGLPYIFFTDNVNKGKADIYKELDLTISHSNLCFTGDTIIKVADGECVAIKNLAEISKGEMKFKVYSAKYTDGEWVTEVKDAVAFKTGTKEVIEVTLSNGDTFKCTPDHTLALLDGNYIEAKDSIGKSLVSKNKESVNVVSIKSAGIEEVYDLTVEDNHNFYITLDKQSVLVHNCAEISLPDNDKESFVCCLSSLNLALYDEWKDTDIVEVITYFLDTVLSEFISKSENEFGLKDSFRFAKRHRAIGIGVMGLHSYYQSKGIAFDDLLNVARNKKIFKDIREKSYAASEKLATILGPAPIFSEIDCNSVGIKPRRNSTTMAIAPTTSSSSILGQVSPGIEPYSSNYFKAGLAKGNFIRKNKYLESLLESKGKNTEDVWRDIMLAQGSVQHLDFLTQEEKNVFKTFKEINQHNIIDQAAARQEYIDQSQSLNINIPSELPIKDVNRLILDAHEKGIKTLYYQRSQSVSKEFLTNIVSCSSCES